MSHIVTKMQKLTKNSQYIFRNSLFTQFLTEKAAMQSKIYFVWLLLFTVQTKRQENRKASVPILSTGYNGLTRKKFFQVVFNFVGLCFQNDKPSVAVKHHKDFSLVVGL